MLKRLLWVWNLVWGLLWAQVQFLRERPSRAAAVAACLLIGSIAGIAPGNVAFYYTWADYRFCDDCHVHDYANEAYARSVHYGLTTCHDCHRVAIRHYPINLYLTLRYGAMTPDEMHPPTVESVVCEQCHWAKQHHELTGPMSEEVRKRIVKVDDSPLHMLHLGSETREPGRYLGGEEGAEEHHGGGHGLFPFGGGEHELPDWDAGVIGCADCHGSEENRAHSFRATRANCVECHSEMETGSGRLKNVSCQECHFWGFASDPSRKDDHDGGHGDGGHGDDGAEDGGHESAKDGHESAKEGDGGHDKEEAPSHH